MDLRETFGPIVKSKEEDLRAEYIQKIKREIACRGGSVLHVCILYEFLTQEARSRILAMYCLRQYHTTEVEGVPGRCSRHC